MTDKHPKRPRGDGSDSVSARLRLQKAMNDLTVFLRYHGSGRSDFRRQISPVEDRRFLNFAATVASRRIFGGVA